MPDANRRRSEASVALICRPERARPRWLARWNRNWQCFYFVGGHKHDDETFRECLEREMREELALASGTHYAVSEGPVARVAYAAESRSAGVETQYVLRVFDVHFVDDAIDDQIVSSQDVRWVTGDEIRACRCADGRPISRTMAFVLDRINWRCAPPPA